MSTKADIAIYGGAAGGGKTWALLLEVMRNVANPRFGAVIFRRTFPQITLQGALWDESETLYPRVGAEPTKSALTWTFPSGAKCVFKHLQHEDSKHDYQGSQIPLIGFDELTHFTETQFFYMLSRNRSTCGVIPYMRGTCNPDANSWVKGFLEPWLNPEYVGPPLHLSDLLDPNKAGDPDVPRVGRAQSGEVRYFTREGGVLRWCSEEEYIEEIVTKPPQERSIKSLTFVRASVYDNKILLRNNPQYLATLKALPLVEQERLLNGNWDVIEAGNMFREEWAPVIFAFQLPTRFKRIVRYWDLAGSKPSEVAKKKNDPDYTVGALMGLGYDGIYYLIHMYITRDTPLRVAEQVKQQTISDRVFFGHGVETWIEQEPGDAGIFLIDTYKTQYLKGFYCQGLPSTGSKIARAKPLSAEMQKLNVQCLADGEYQGCLLPEKRRWRQQFLAMATAFPNPDVHDDVVDAASGAYNVINMPLEEDIYVPRVARATGWRQ